MDGRVKPGQDGWRLAEGRVDPRIKSWIKSGDGQDELRLSNPNRFGPSTAPSLGGAGATLAAGAAGHAEGAAVGTGFGDFFHYVMTGLVPVIHAVPLLISTDA